MMLPIISLLLAIPFVGAWITAFSGENARKVALATALAELALSVWATITAFHPEAGTQWVENQAWIPALGISYHVGLDGISLILVLLTTVLLPLIIQSAAGRQTTNPGLYFSLMLFMQSALIGVFAAQDGFLFYLFWELALIPIYLIALIWGGPDRKRITLKFFLYTLFGSLFMLVAFVWMRTQTADQSFDIHSFYALHLSGVAQQWVFWALFLAFAIKMPVWPLHTWQPDTYTDSPTQGTMLLSGIMLKMGIYGAIRWMLPVVPGAFSQWGSLIMILSVAGIVYASLMAWYQKDIKRLIAYSSIAHVGIIAAGVFSLSEQGLAGSLVQMVAHGVNAIGLFFVADILFNRTQTRELTSLGGIRTQAPQFATVFMIVMLGSVALPLTNGFIGEFMLMGAIFQYSSLLAAVAGLTAVFGAVYMLNAYRLSMLGESTRGSAVFTDLSASEKWTLFPVVALVIVLGVYPEIIMNIVEPSVKALHDVLTNAHAPVLP